MLLEQIKPPVFNTDPKIQAIVKEFGLPSKEALDALRKKKKCQEYDVVKKATV